MLDHHIDGTNLCTKRCAKIRLRQYVLDSWNGACAYCGEHLGRGATLDHVVPKAKGGMTVPENLVGCCLLCNSQKGHSRWDEWYRDQPFWDAVREAQIWSWLNPCEEGEEMTA